MPASTPASDDLQSWVGRTETVQDLVTPQLAQRLAATIETPRAAQAVPGDELPQLWYSVLFPRVVPRSQLGRDGHPALGDFLPPVDLPKRMFAGKRIRFVAPILVGDSLERVSTIASITPKTGSTGPLVFVTIRHDIRRGAELLVSEEQDVVYRTESSGTPKPAKQAPAFDALHESADIVVDPVMIFRYSALCFNGHRIHYDRKYTTEVEGYPGLVVNGGLSALCVVEHLHQSWGGRMGSLSTRNVSPLFEGESFRAESKAGEAPGSVDFRTVTSSGKVVVTGTAVLEGGRR